MENALKLYTRIINQKWLSFNFLPSYCTTFVHSDPVHTLWMGIYKFLNLTTVINNRNSYYTGNTGIKLKAGSSSAILLNDASSYTPQIKPAWIDNHVFTTTRNK